MRKTITLLLAAMVVMTAFAQKEGVQQRPAPKAHSLPAAYEKGVAAKAKSLTAAPEKGMKMTLKADLQRDKSAASKVNRPHKATALITEAPEGETKYYNRAGNAYYSSSGTAIADTQEGMLTIVYAANNEVYLLDPVCYLSTGTYVKGTISGNTITVPLPQTVYNSSYGYNLEIAWVNIPAGATSPITLYDGTTLADRETTEATYTIDGNTITLNGSSATHLLGGVWDDDETWYGAGDYNSVYTETQLEDVVTPPAGVTPETYYYSGKSYYSSADHKFSSTVQVVKDGNDVYIQGLATGDADREILPEAWAKGTLDGTTLTIPQGQYMGLYGSQPIYLVGYTSGVDDITFTYDADADTYTLDNIMIVNTLKESISYYCYTEAEALISKEEPVVPTVVEVPDGLETETWLFTAQDLSFDDDDNAVYEDVSRQVQVGFDGNDVYVQGLCDYLPDAWVKGVRNGNTVTFATGQYFGAYEYWGEEYDMFFVGYGENGIGDITFTMNADENKLTADDWVIINAEQTSLSYYSIYTEPVLTKIVEVAAMPAMPSVTSVTLTGTSYPKINLNVPIEDEDGNPMLTNKLYYKVYTDVEGTIAEYVVSPDDYEEISEEMIEIPYDFNDHWDIYPGGDPFYVYGNYADWNRVGVQSIYYGGDERNATEINWFFIKDYETVQLYVAGTFTNWTDDKQHMEKGEDGLYTIEVEMEENAEFKLIDSSENWYGGVTDGQNFVITEEQIAQGTPLELSNPGMNFVMPNAGKYTLTADMENMKLVVARIEEPVTENLFVLGDFQGWKPNEGLQMTYDAENKVYTATITPEEEGCFKFTTQLAETEEWTIDEYLWGADSEGDFVVMRDQMGADLSLIAKGQAFRIPAGEWTLTASLEDGTLVIEGDWPEEAMYVAGSFTNWSEDMVAMEKGEDGLYTIEIEIAMPTEGNAEFKFVDEFGKWYGGITDGQNFLITEEQINEQTPLDLSIPGMNFELPFPGNYKLVVDRENMKLVIVKLGDVLVGDVNGDGIVNGSDVTSLYNVLLDDAQVAGDADVNGDGIVNGSDVTALYNILLGD